MALPLWGAGWSGTCLLRKNDMLNALRLLLSHGGGGMGPWCTPKARLTLVHLSLSANWYKGFYGQRHLCEI